MILPKPQKRTKAPRPLRRSAQPARKSRPRKRSAKRYDVEAKDRAWAESVKDLASHRCQACWRHQTVAPLDGHHIRSKKAHPRLRWDLLNGIALCRPCHQMAHQFPWAFKTWVLKDRPEVSALWESK